MSGTYLAYAGGCTALSAYARATACPVLTWRRQCLRYAISGTNILYGNAMSGTEIEHGATRPQPQPLEPCGPRPWRTSPVCSYA
eukprot:3426504-Rhodomonas_salina.6